MNGTGANVLIKFTGDTKDVDGKMKGLNKTMGSVTKGFVAGSLITKGLSTAFNMVSSSASSAVKRIDTMNNFPKVMKNFGVSADEASASVKRIDESVRGLPTSLDQAVSGVQNIFMVTKNLPEAEKMFKAVNDSAMVFANGSTEAVDRFIYSYKQAMSAGKASAQDFNSMNDAIPGLMDKVAESMGMTYQELKSGLSSGKISMEQFNTALKKLDTEGGAGMKSLEKVAKDSTGGIQTAITNMKTAITRGLANAFGELDKSLKSAGLGGISGVISSIGKGFESALKAIVPLIPPIIKALVSIFKWLQKHQKLLKIVVGAVVAFVAAFKAVKIIIGIINAVKTALMALKAIMIVVNAVMLANPIGLIVAAIAALIAIFVLLWKKCDWFRNFWIGLWEKIKSAFLAVWEALKGAFTAVIDWIKTNWKQILLFLINPFWGAFSYLYKHSEKFRNFINKIVNAIVGYFKALPGKIKAIPGKIVNFFKNLPSKLWEAGKQAVIKLALGIIQFAFKVYNKVQEIKNKIIGFFKEIPKKMLNIGKAIITGLWDGAKKMKNWVIEKIKGLGKAILKGMKKVLGIASPSKEFAIIGKFSVLGYTEALDKMKNDVQKQIDSTFGLSPTLTGTASTHYSPQVNVINNVNVKQDPLGQMVKQVKTFSGGSKNDYNYGMGV